MKTLFCSIALTTALHGAALASPSMYMIYADHDEMDVLDRTTIIANGANRRGTFHTYYSTPLNGNVRHLVRVKEYDCSHDQARDLHVSGFTSQEQRVADAEVTGSRRAWIPVEAGSINADFEAVICHPAVPSKHLDFVSHELMLLNYLSSISGH